MLKTARCVLAASLLLSLASLAQGAFAQSQPAVGTPVETGKPGLVDAATQGRIRDYVRKENVPAAPVAELSIGAVVPDTVTLYALPEDAVTEVPTVTSYRFAVIGDRIVAVNPINRTVVQFIDR